MVAVLKSLIWELFTQQFQYLWIPTMNEGQKKHWKKCRIVPQWKSLTFGSVSMVLRRWELVGELLGENTSVTTFSIRHRCHTHHLLSHSAQQILKFLHREILKINKTQNSKIWILLGMVYYTHLKGDCWSFVGLIIIHKIYTTVNQSKILNTFWYKYQRLWMEQWASFIKGTLRALFSIKRKLALSAFTAGSLGTSELRGL